MKKITLLKREVAYEIIMRALLEASIFGSKIDFNKLKDDNYTLSDWHAKKTILILELIGYPESDWEGV